MQLRSHNSSTRRLVSQDSDQVPQRARFVILALYTLFAVIAARLFYWQIVMGDELTQQAELQYTRTLTKEGLRGTVTTSDGHLLVGNQEVYTLFAQPQVLTEKPELLAKILAPVIAQNIAENQRAGDSASLQTILTQTEQDILTKLRRETKWIALKHNLPEEVKQKITELKLDGVGFDTHHKRLYPEASLAAHVLGFVGKNEQGLDTGYFGIEGALEKELQARTSTSVVQTDALGKQFSTSTSLTQPTLDGRDITLTIRRDIQKLIEQELALAIEKYQAKSGEVVVLDPNTGEILGLAAQPTYEPELFHQYPAETYKNPTISNLYEPGSTLKSLTVAIGLEENKITPETTCDSCGSARVFGKYRIKTWNDQYTPNITMKDALAKSDNTAMIFIAEKIGTETFQEYLKKLGLSQKVGVELQEDSTTPFPTQWNPVRLATVSFGQGIVLNSLQLVKAFTPLANGGFLIEPSIIQSVLDPNTGLKMEQAPAAKERVFSKETTQQMTNLLVQSAQAGEAQWAASDTYIAAGKTGTSQVVTENGYDAEKTIVSFIGFAPPKEPQFVLLVKLVEPKTSPWAAETAAPTWHIISRKLHFLLNIPL